MNRLCYFITLSLLFASSLFAQDKLNSEQLELRGSIETFLREEGFMPGIDSDGDLYFKKEGDKYYVIIDSRDTSPFYLTLSKYFSYKGGYTRQTIASHLDDLNIKKAVKVLLSDESYVLQAEMYVVSSEQFKYVFYKLMKQLNALEEAVDEFCSGSGSSSYQSGSSGGSDGKLLVNEEFSSYSSNWRKSGGKLSFSKGKMLFEDTDGSGYAELFYDLPRNLRNEDFELKFSLKATFRKTHSPLFFIMGTKWNDAYWFGFTKWSGDGTVLSYGTYDDSTEYQNYNPMDFLSVSSDHQYRMVKRGNKVEWYADGRFLFSSTIKLSTDMNLLGFLVPNKHKIEVDNVRVKLLQ